MKSFMKKIFIIFLMNQIKMRTKKTTKKKKKTTIKKQADKVNDWVKKETTLPKNVMGL